MPNLKSQGNAYGTQVTSTAFRAAFLDPSKEFIIIEKGKLSQILIKHCFINLGGGVEVQLYVFFKSALV
jgi:hypothetical protein